MSTIAHLIEVLTDLKNNNQLPKGSDDLVARSRSFNLSSNKSVPIPVTKPQQSHQKLLSNASNLNLQLEKQIKDL